MRVGIITIGTEITSGEVVNSNAASLAQKLESLHFNIPLHISVPDSLREIKEAFEYAAGNVDMLVTTGGLGPTSDDFTRDVIAEWMELPLEFNEEIYLELERSFAKMGRTLKSGHRNQCLFPKGSRILKNPVGHAQPFFISNQHVLLYALPGPPREIEGIWLGGWEEELRKYNLSPEKKLFKWKIFGRGESDVATVTEEIFKNSGFELGYRASVPFVIVKVWVPSEKLPSFEAYKRDFEKEFSTDIVSRDEWSHFGKSLLSFEKIRIADSVTYGQFLTRLLQLQPQLSERLNYDTRKKAEGYIKGFDLQICLRAEGEKAWRLELHSLQGSQSWICSTPYSIKNSSKRLIDFFVELAAKEINAKLSAAVS